MGAAIEPLTPRAGAPAEAPPSEDSTTRLLEFERDRAERRLNGLRAVVLALLAAAALAYAPRLTTALNRANVLVLLPTLAWTLAQYLLFYRRERLPGWLSVVNPVVDISAVTAILAGYGLAQSADLALKSPIFLAYFVILAGRPIASSASRAALMSALVVAEYGALVGYFLVAGRVRLIASPVAASSTSGVSPLDEGAKILLLAVASLIATYATAWHERLAKRYYRETRDRERLETRLAQAQLESLKLQLHPHFLFNTLNTITALISTDGRAAERMVSGLSELLRISLRNAGEHEVPLERELELLEHYVEIQRVRFPDRLTVEFDIEPETRDALVPNLILQPLVENAIRYGIAPRATPGRVEVRARREGDDTLCLRVSNDGDGLTATPAREGSGHGIGLGNAKARLRHLYGERQRLDLERIDGGGLAVSIAIPFRARHDERPVAAGSGRE